MSSSSKNGKDEDTSGVSLACYNKQDAENKNKTFLNDEKKEKISEIKKLRLIEEPHKFDELIDCIRNRDLERLKNSIEKMCKFCLFFLMKVETLVENNDIYP